MNRKQLLTYLKAVIFPNTENLIDATKHQVLEENIINSLLTKEDDLVNDPETGGLDKAPTAELIKKFNETIVIIQNQVKELTEANKNLQTQLTSLANLGQYVGSFDTYGDIPTTQSGFLPLIVTPNDFVDVRADENNSGRSARYRVSNISVTGDITWSFDMLIGGTGNRVIAFMISDNEVIIPIGENLIFSEIYTRNVSKLYIKPNDGVSDWEQIAINSPIIKNISKDYDLMVKVERIITDPYASIYIIATKTGTI